MRIQGNNNSNKSFDANRRLIEFPWIVWHTELWQIFVVCFLNHMTRIKSYRWVTYGLAEPVGDQKKGQNLRKIEAPPNHEGAVVHLAPDVTSRTRQKQKWHKRGASWKFP